MVELVTSHFHCLACFHAQFAIGFLLGVEVGARTLDASRDAHIVE